MIAAGVATAVVEVRAVMVRTIKRYAYKVIAPVINYTRPVIRRLFRQGRTSMNAVSPDALILIGGEAAA